MALESVCEVSRILYFKILRFEGKFITKSIRTNEAKSILDYKHPKKMIPELSQK